MAKPNVRIMKKTAEALSLELPKGDVMAAANVILEHFKTTFGADALVECPTCEMDGPEFDANGAMVAACPYCGQVFLEQPAVEKPPEPPKKVRAQAPTAEGEPVKKGRGRPKAEETVETHIVTPEQQKALAEKEAIIDGLRHNMAKNTYEIGKHLVDINDGALYKGMGFKNFYDYVNNRFGISRSGSYKYMICARKFTAEQFLQIGVKRGELIASAAEQHQPVLIEAVLSGATHTDLKNRLNTLEGKVAPNVAVPQEGDVSSKLTLLGRVKEGNIVVNWIDSKTHQPVERANVKDKYLRIQLTDNVELVLISDEDGRSCTANFRKLGEEKPAKEKKAKAEKPAADPNAPKKGRGRPKKVVDAEPAPEGAPVATPAPEAAPAATLVKRRPAAIE